MKITNPGLFAATNFVLVTHARLVPREKLRSRETSDSGRDSENVAQFRTLQEIGSMSYPGLESISTWPDVTTAGKSRSGKSGKGPYIPDHSWVKGNYTKCTRTLITLQDGEVDDQVEDQDCTGVHTFAIESLNDSSRMYMVTFMVLGGNPCYAIGLTDAECPNTTRPGFVDSRSLYKGVASYRPSVKDEITFYTDHQEVLLKNTNSGELEWVQLGNPIEEDVSTLTCERLEDYPDGRTIACDSYAQVRNQTVQREYIGTYFLEE